MSKAGIKKLKTTYFFVYGQIQVYVDIDYEKKTYKVYDNATLPEKSLTVAAAITYGTVFIEFTEALMHFIKEELDEIKTKAKEALLAQIREEKLPGGPGGSRKEPLKEGLVDMRPRGPRKKRQQEGPANYKPKKCVNCGNEFIPRSGRSTFCDHCLGKDKKY